MPHTTDCSYTVHVIFLSQEFDYDVTILAFNIRIELLTAQYFFAKGYG